MIKLTPAEAANRIRAAIKREFPKTEFSVRALTRRKLVQVRWAGRLSHAKMRSLCKRIGGSSYEWAKV